MNQLTRWWLTTMNPDWYHGHGRKKPFFEGWYFKLIDPTTMHKLAIIPGVFLSNDPHAFIQVLDGTTSAAWYHRFPLDQFWAAEDRFEIRVGNNVFNADEITLAVDRSKQKIHGSLRFSGKKKWPVRITAPGIMGWYAWIPTMECYHGVVSLDHSIEGALTFNEQLLDFNGGRGYIEKDWGQSFPSAWIWMQTNHFEQVGTSLTASIAMIPWQFTRFRGFLVGFWHKGKLYRFATYTGAKTVSLTVGNNEIEWMLTGRTAGAAHRLHIIATRGEAGIIAGPSTVSMGKRVAESLTAVISVTLTHIEQRKEQLVFEGEGNFGGLEVYNVAEELLSAI
ncbi:MAG: hypothetical protein IZT55_06470 [Anaerolineae bacterium]|nr:hypothetical protein [Anaerolineae bacterium]